MSLVERKKRQWAQERAEMESLCTPWGLPPPAYGFSHQQNRSRYSSTLEIRDTCPMSAQQDLLPRRQRSPSLPPILNFHPEQDNNQNETADGSTMKFVVKSTQDTRQTSNNVKYRYEDGEGETSGYASDSIPQSSPEFWQNKLKYSKNGTEPIQRTEKTDSIKNFSEDLRNQHPVSAWNQSARRQEEERAKRWSRNDVPVEDQRPRWGDRGVAAGRLWEPQEPGARLPQVTAKGTPTWVERSLNMIDNGDSQILIIDQQSNHSSGGDTTEYRMSDQQEKNTYLLGQNVPIEPNIKAEREYRRLKALELQAAIVQQLEDRERQKREEKERRIKEEREEEERFRRQQELERQRLDEERRVAEEKQKREQKRAEALRLALERAEQQAKLDKENKKNKRLRDRFDAMSINSEDIQMDKSTNRSPRKESSQHTSSANGESKLIQNIYIEQAFSPGRNLIQDQNKLYQGSETNIIMSNPQSARYSCQSDGSIHEQQFKDPNKRIETPKQNPAENLNTLLHGNQPMSMMPDPPLSLVQIPLTQELFTPINMAHGSGVQMAFLVPQNMNSVYPCIHQPISMQALFTADMNHQKYSYQMHSHTDTDESSSNRDRASKVLTPSKYRNPNCKDVSTQTDIIEPVALKQIGIEETSKRRSKSNDNAYEINLEQNASEEKLNSLTSKKEKRMQSEERLANKDIESRPKWGVNKPPTQYKKQSEKDIFYSQKRKLRQRKRAQEKHYTSHSSDDNRSPSPAKNAGEKNRVSLSDYHWRKKGVKPDKNIYPGNATVETTQILPLECDQSGIVHIGENIHYHSQKRIYAEKKASPPKRGITLSQKFMNDKYGNPKLWQDNMLPSESKNKYEEELNVKIKDKLENRKKYVDSLNMAKREQSNYYKDEETNQPLILDQLRSLRDSLKKQQQIWGKYDNDRRSPSPKNEVDLEME